MMIDEMKLIEEIKSMVRPLLTPDGTAYFDDAIQAHNETIVDVLNTIERQPKVGEWIPVEEGMPKAGQDVMVTRSNGNIDVGFYTSCRHWILNRTNKKTCPVIAWMPLPEHYRKEDNK